MLSADTLAVASADIAFVLAVASATSAAALRTASSAIAAALAIISDANADALAAASCATLYATELVTAADASIKSILDVRLIANSEVVIESVSSSNIKEMSITVVANTPLTALNGPA